MIPGLRSPLMQTGLVRAYSADASNVDPWLELGSPAVAIQAQILIGAGVKIGSASVNSPAMLIRFYDGSTVDIVIAGKAGAAGGDGGDGDRHGDGGGVGSFRGGGGGGGAGLNPGAKGLRYPESDPDAGNTDGVAGTETAGGSGGVSDFGGDIPNQSYVAGDQTNRIAKNPAIMIWPADGHSITVNIWCSGEIAAGGNGGRGGYLDGSLPGGANDGEDGEDLPAYYDPTPGALTDHPAIGYRSGQVTLNIREGGAYPTIKGRIVPFTSLP